MAELHKNFFDFVDFILKGVAEEFECGPGWAHARKTEMVHEIADMPESAAMALNFAAGIKLSWPIILKIVIKIIHEEGGIPDDEKMNLKMLAGAC